MSLKHGGVGRGVTGEETYEIRCLQTEKPWFYCLQLYLMKHTHLLPLEMFWHIWDVSKD